LVRGILHDVRGDLAIIFGQCELGERNCQRGEVDIAAERFARVRMVAKNASQRINSVAPERGLGLAIVRSAVKELGAQMVIDSRRGKGACISITFPPVRDPNVLKFNLGDAALKFGAAIRNHLERFGIKLMLDVDHYPYVAGDELKAQSILQNLCINARDAICQARQETGLITICMESLETGVILQVRDNGPGFPEPAPTA